MRWHVSSAVTRTEIPERLAVWARRAGLEALPELPSLKLFAGSLRQQCQCQRIALSGKKRLQRSLERLVGVRDSVEQSQTRAQLQVVGRPENVVGRMAWRCQQKSCAFLQARPEQWMAPVGGRLGMRFEPEMPGCRTAAQRLELREDEPHPVRHLLSGSQFSANRGIDGRLRLDKSVERCHHKAGTALQRFMRDSSIAGRPTYSDNYRCRSRTEP